MLGGREAVLEAALGRSDAGPTRCCAYTDARDAGRRSVVGAVSLGRTGARLDILCGYM
jgi:hypothetical protein